MAAVYLGSFGCLTPHGAGRRALPESGALPLRTAPDGLDAREAGPLPAAGWIEPLSRPAELRGRRLRFGRLGRLAQLALVAAHHAVQAPGLPAVAQRAEAGIAFGTAFGSHLANECFQVQLERRRAEEASPSIFTYTLPSATVGEISILFGLQGATVTLTGGIGSGIAALALAARLVRRGEARWMLAGGAEALGPTLVAALGRSATLAEAAAFFTVTAEPKDALARVAGAAQGNNVSLRVVEEQALESGGIPRNRLRQHLAYDDAGEFPMERLLGRSGAVAPLLGICSVLHRPSLPALISVRDRGGAVDALCVDDVAGGEEG